MTIITQLPVPPSRTTPSQFSSRADAFLGALPGFVTETNAVAGEVNADKTTAVNSAGIAVTKAAEAVAAAAAAAGDANAAQWVSGTTYTIGTVVWSPSNYLSYIRKTNGAGTTDPMSDPTNWAPRVPTQIYRQTRTSNTILARADDRAIIDITSGTFTQTFSACTTLGNGWSCVIRNSGVGDVTLDPDGAETIDGLASFVMYPGESRLIQCDGSSLLSTILTPFYKVFTTSGIFTRPPGYSAFRALMWAGGNSGRKSGSVTVASQGGGGGGCFDFIIQACSLPVSTPVLVGSGGAAVTSTAYPNFGGTTSFGDVASVYPGSGENGLSGGSVVSGLHNPTLTQSAGFEGGSSNGTLPSHAIWGGSASSRDGSFASGNSVYGGAAGGSLSASAVVSAAGVSQFGGNGGAASSSGNGTAGVAPGGGGGATQTGSQSGAGARGECRVWGVA